MTKNTIPMFHKDDTTVHLPTGLRYDVHGTPDEYSLHDGGGPAYILVRQSIDPAETRRKWVIAQTKMEDGRFALVKRPTPHEAVSYA